MTDTTTLETKRALAEEARAAVQAFNELLNSMDVHPDSFEDFAECYGTVQEEDQHAHNLQLAIKSEMSRLEARARKLELGSFKAEFDYLDRDAEKLGFSLMVENGRFIVTSPDQVNAVTSGFFEEVAKCLADMIEEQMTGGVPDLVKMLNGQHVTYLKPSAMPTRRRGR